MLSLKTKQRDELLALYRKDPDPELRFRAHIILLLGDGHAWDTIEAMLFCSSRTVDRWLKRFQVEGVAGLAGKKRGRPFRLGFWWVIVLTNWVTRKVPRISVSSAAAGPAPAGAAAPRAARRDGQSGDRAPDAAPGPHGLPAAPAGPSAE